MIWAVGSIFIALLSLAAAFWIPTLAIVLGVTAIGMGYLGRRSLLAVHEGGATSSPPERVAAAGIALGIGALVATVIVIFVTTHPK